MANEIPWVPKAGDRARVDELIAGNAVAVGCDFTIKDISPAENGENRRGGYFWFHAKEGGSIFLARVSPLPASPATPPDVAAPGDRLFDNGRCCLCGEDEQNWKSGSGEDDWYCTECARQFGHPGSQESRLGAFREFERRRALQTPPAPEKWEPVVGQWCEGYDRTEPGVLRVGRFIQFVGEDYAGRPYPAAEIGGDGTCDSQLVARDTLRPATSPPVEAERKAAAVNSCMVCFAAIPSGHQVCAYCSHVKVEQSDGDRNVTRIKNRERREERIAALSTGDSLDRLAARKQRQRGELLGEMGRKVELPRYVGDWDAEDAQPLTVS